VGAFDEKKNRSKKSHASVPLKTYRKRPLFEQCLQGGTYRCTTLSTRQFSLGNTFKAPSVALDIRAGHALFLRFALALSRSLAELFALALSHSFLGLKFRAFAFALSRSRAP
jgi:hypothetical protein